MGPFSAEVYAERRRRVGERMQAQDVDLMFVPPSADLEYLTGARRRLPTFGNISYTHGWVCGAFLRPGQEPLLVLPRMVAEFDMPKESRATSWWSTSSTTETPCSNGS